MAPVASPLVRRRRRPDEEGAALVELALMMFLLCLLLFGVMDFGRVYYHAIAVTQAVRSGVQYGALNLTQASDSPGMVAAATAAASDITGFTAGANHKYWCWNGTTDTAMNDDAKTPTCSGTVRVYVMVTGTKVFTTFLNFPGYPHTITITRAARMRVQ